MGKRSKTQVIDGERHRILRKTFTRVIKFMTYDKDSSVQGLPWWLSGKGSTYQRRRLRFHPWVRKIPWRRKWQPTLVFLPGELHGPRSLVGYSPWSPKRVGHDLVTKQLQFRWNYKQKTQQQRNVCCRVVSQRKSLIQKTAQQHELAVSQVTPLCTWLKSFPKTLKPQVFHNRSLLTSRHSLSYISSQDSATS